MKRFPHLCDSKHGNSPLKNQLQLIELCSRYMTLLGRDTRLLAELHNKYAKNTSAELKISPNTLSREAIDDILGDCVNNEVTPLIMALNEILKDDANLKMWLETVRSLELQPIAEYLKVHTGSVSSYGPEAEVTQLFLSQEASRIKELDQLAKLLNEFKNDPLGNMGILLELSYRYLVLTNGDRRLIDKLCNDWNGTESLPL